MKRLLFTSLFLVSLSSVQASAATITYQFTGSITGLIPALEEQFSLNDILIGRFDVETSGTQQTGRTIYQASNLSVTIGGEYTVTGTTGSMIITDDSLSGDGITVSFSNSSAPSVFGTPVNSSSPGYFDIQLDWFGGEGPLSSQALPIYAPVNTGEIDRSNINFPSDSERLSYKLTSMSVVPVPAAAWLFGSSLLGLIGLKRRV